MLEISLVAQSVWNAGLAVSLDLDLVFSTNIHMILDTQVQLQTLYFSPSTLFANVRWKLVESVLLYLTLITVISVLLLSVEWRVLSPRLRRQTDQPCHSVVVLWWRREERGQIV